MEVIDISDLSEEEAQVIQDMLESFRKKAMKEKDEETGWSGLAMNSFARDWDNEKDDSYNSWEEHYHVRKG